MQAISIESNKRPPTEPSADRNAKRQKHGSQYPPNRQSHYQQSRCQQPPRHARLHAQPSHASTASNTRPHGTPAIPARNQAMGPPPSAPFFQPALPATLRRTKFDNADVFPFLPGATAEEVDKWSLADIAGCLRNFLEQNPDVAQFLLSYTPLSFLPENVQAARTSQHSSLLNGVVDYPRAAKVRRQTDQKYTFLPSKEFLLFRLQNGYYRNEEDLLSQYLDYADCTAVLHDISVYVNYHQNTDFQRAAKLDIRACDFGEIQDIKQCSNPQAGGQDGHKSWGPWGATYGENHQGIFGKTVGGVRLMLMASSYRDNLGNIPPPAIPFLGPFIDVNDEVPAGLPDGVKIFRTLGRRYAKYTLVDFRRVRCLDHDTWVRQVPGGLATDQECERFEAFACEVFESCFKSKKEERRPRPDAATSRGGLLCRFTGGLVHELNVPREPFPQQSTAGTTMTTAGNRNIFRPPASTVNNPADRLVPVKPKIGTETAKILDGVGVFDLSDGAPMAPPASGETISTSTSAVSSAAAPYSDEAMAVKKEAAKEAAKKAVLARRAAQS